MRSVSEHEVAVYEEQGKQLVNSYLNFFTSDGVVTALVLSIILPLTFEADVDGGILALLSAMCVHAATACSLFTLMYLANLYTQLPFHVPNLKAQLFYIDQIQSFMPILVIVKNISFILAAVAYVFQSLSVQGWFGLVSLLAVAGTVIPVVHLVAHVCGNVYNPYLRKQAKVLLARSGSAAADLHD